LLNANRLLVLALIVAIAIIIGLAAALIAGGRKAEAPVPGATPGATPGAGASATQAANACGPNPASAPPNVGPADFGYRKIASPAPGSNVRSPLHVAGDANPFEGAFSLTVVDGGGRQIASMNYNKSNLSLAFMADLPLAVSAPTAACLWYHERSGRDGSPVAITQIPVTLLP